jgi:hypothetical protein
MVDAAGREYLQQWYKDNPRKEPKMSPSAVLGLIGIGTSLGNPALLLLAGGSFLYSEWDSNKKDIAIGALNDKIAGLSHELSKAIANKELGQQITYESAVFAFEQAVNYINEAAEYQEKIGNASSGEDISALEKKRDDLRQKASEATEKGHYFEYVARYGRQRDALPSDDVLVEERNIHTDELADWAIKAAQARKEVAQKLLAHTQSMQAEIERLQAKGQDTTAQEELRDRLIKTAEEALAMG